MSKEKTIVEVVQIIPQEDIRKALRDRAVKLAVMNKGEAQSQTEMIEILEFELSNEVYAFATKFIREVVPLKFLTDLPLLPNFLRGIMNLRGEIISVNDIRSFFDLPPNSISDLNRVIVLNNQSMCFGILADKIYGIRKVDIRSIISGLPAFHGVRAEYLIGITNQQTALLDAEKFLNDKSLLIDEEI